MTINNVVFSLTALALLYFTHFWQAVLFWGGECYHCKNSTHEIPLKITNAYTCTHTHSISLSSPNPTEVPHPRYHLENPLFISDKCWFCTMGSFFFVLTQTRKDRIMIHFSLSAKTKQIHTV